jgi:hypothetical protein
MPWRRQSLEMLVGVAKKPQHRGASIHESLRAAKGKAALTPSGSAKNQGL